MAIPFVLPSNDEAEAQGQQLEQLMLDLYAALQQVLRSRNAQHPSRNQMDVYSAIVLCMVMWFIVTCLNRTFLSFAI